jgi:hypothetical protein
VLEELGLTEHVLLWNVVPTHPHRPASLSQPRPGREIEASRPFLVLLTACRRIVPVGRIAEAAIGKAGIRHPSHGGAQEFRAGLAALV